MKTCSPNLFSLPALFFLCVALLSAAPPNIVVIMTDDQGYGDLGIHGNPVLDTPRIDAFARQSATLARFYVSPVCSPTRASLLTGRYNYRTRAIDTFKGRSMMDPAEVTVAELLRSAGYATGIFGKWHLGDAYPLRATDQGFEEALIHNGGGLAQPSEPIANARRYTDPVLLHNNELVPTRGFCTDVFFDGALRFMQRSRAAGRPFFVYLTPNAPHDPLHDVPEGLYQKYKNRDLSPVLLGKSPDADALARVYAMVENIDQNVGRLLDWLDHAGLARDTLVLFLCDNGPASLRYVGPLRGRKSEPFEGGIRSPFYARWPARFPAGSWSDRIAAHIDILPTLLEAAAVPLPAELRLDGRSLLPLLAAPAGASAPPAWPDRTLFIQSHRGDRPVEFHNFAAVSQRWKLLHPTGFGSETLPGDVPFALYDIPSDPGESRDLAASQPEVLRQMLTAYSAWFADVASTRPDNFAPPRIVIGSETETTTMLTRQDWRVVPSAPGWGPNGVWLLHAARPAEYEVVLLFPEPVPPGTVSWTFGPVAGSLTTTAPAASIPLGTLRLPAGDLDVRLTLEHGDTRTGAYHVLLYRW